jgi:flagellar hook-basal body complex protein FliE
VDGNTTGLSAALAAYGRALGHETTRPAPGGAEPAAASFAAVLEQTLVDARDAGSRSEAASLQAIAGKASLQEVVEAINAAEVTLQTVVAVRDRMISAYQEIIRMPI